MVVEKHETDRQLLTEVSGAGLPIPVSAVVRGPIETPINEEILINVTPQETRIAVVENGVLVEICVERERRRGLVGNIYQGRVARVLPGMEAAFIEIGLERAAFLHVSDIAGAAHLPEGASEPQHRPVREMLREGQDLLVQVVKDPLGTKGARLTTELTIASRFLVIMPQSAAIGISSKIDDDQERERLRQIVAEQTSAEPACGYIVRTVAESASEALLVHDMRFLQKLWRKVTERARGAKAGDCVYEDLPLMLRILRDLAGAKVERIRVDSVISFQRMRQFAEEFVPEMAQRIEHYPGERPIFDLYGIEEELQKALQSKVQLKSGGYLIIDQTEAMTTIDVNTGAFVGHRNLEETIFKTNLEAAQAIARQLRLRNLGGIIIIDFIDMIDVEHRQQVLRALEKSLDRDHAKSNICEVSSLGLVEMTRKRIRESLEHTLCETCPTCSGRGKLKTPETVCFEIFREILREARQFDADQLMVLAAQEVIDRLLDEESNSLAELEAFVGIPIRLQMEAMYTQEQYDVVLV